MRHYSWKDFNDRTGRIWFNANKWEVIPASIEATFEEPEIEIIAINGSVGDVDATMEPLEADWGGFKGIKGHIVGQAENMDLSMSASYIPPINADMECSLLQMDFFCSSGRYLTAELQQLEFVGYSQYRSKDMDNLEFKELTMFATGENSFRYLEAEIRPLTCEMFVGTALAFGFEQPTMEGTGTNGLVAGMRLRMREPEALFLGGPLPRLEATTEQLQAMMSGDSEIVSNLSASFRRPEFYGTGQNGYVANIDVEFLQLRAQLTQDFKHQVGSLRMSFQPLHARLEDREKFEGDILARVRQIECEMFAQVTGTNDLNLEVKTPGIQMTADIGLDGSCDLAETLVFED